MNLRAFLGLAAALMLSSAAHANCDNHACHGVVSRITVNPAVVSIEVVAPDAAIVTDCVATGNGGMATFILMQSHPRYSEAFAVLHAASITGRQLLLEAEVSPGSPCRLGQVSQE
jgi:hypothetical protein